MREDKSEIEQEIKDCNVKIARIVHAYPWIILVCYCMLLVASLTVFIQVVLIRQRREYFIVLTLSCYIIQSCVNTTLFAIYTSPNVVHDEWIIVLLSLGQFLSMMAHWLYSSQYLKTSKTFPRQL